MSERDVYAGDLNLNVATSKSRPPAATRITISADPDPDVLLRIAVILNTLNSAPLEFHLRTAEIETKVDVTLKDCPESVGDMLCRKLRQLTCVLSVECTPQ
jgi:hypothetical protein